MDWLAKHFSEALHRKVEKLGCDNVIQNFGNGVHSIDAIEIATSDRDWLETLIYERPENILAPTLPTLINVFVEWLSGGPKSKVARDFIIGTCRAAMAAGV